MPVIVRYSTVHSQCIHKGYIQQLWKHCRVMQVVFFFPLPNSNKTTKDQYSHTDFFSVCVCLIFFYKTVILKNFCGCLWDAEILLLHQHTVISRLNPLQKAQDSCGDWFVSMKGKGAGGWTKKTQRRWQRTKNPRWIYNKIINIKTRKIMIWSSTSRLDKRQQEPLAHMHLWWKRCWIRWEVKRHNKYTGAETAL